MLGRYGAILTAPLVLPLVGSALLHGLATATAPLALVLLVAERSGSYGGAGVVSATYIVANGIVAPVWGRCVDRFGPTRTLVPLALWGASGFWLLVALAVTDAPVSALAAAAGLTGVGQAPVTSTLRSMWPRVVPDADHMQAANALQAMMYDLFSVTGPLLAGALVALASPEAAIAFTAAALLVADLSFAAQRPVRNWRPGAHVERGIFGVLRLSGLRTLVACSLPAGVAIGIVEVAAPAFADQRGEAASRAIALAALATGSMVGALLYGAVSWRSPAPTRYARLSVGLAAGLAHAASAESIAMLAALLLLAGLAIGPITTTVLGLLDDIVPASAATEAFTWVITAFLVGIGIGAILGGALYEAAGAGVAFLAASAAALLEIAVVTARRKTLTPLTAT